MQKSGRWCPMLSLTGAVGDNLLAPCLKLTRASCGLSPFQPTPSSTQAMAARARTSTAPKRVLCSPTPWVVRTATCQTSECGPITPRSWPRNMAFPKPRRTNSPVQCWRARRGLMKTRCPGNWPTWSQGAWLTCWICKAPITPWTLLAPPPWPLFSTLAVCSKPVKSTSC